MPVSLALQLLYEKKVKNVALTSSFVVRTPYDDDWSTYDE
jgi:hypothetical protein